MQELIPINVWLSGRSYRIRIPKEEEAAVRNAVKVADEKIQELRQHYAGKDDQDFMAMCLLMYATEAATSGGAVPAAMQDTLAAMTDRIRKELNKD